MWLQQFNLQHSRYHGKPHQEMHWLTQLPLHKKEKLSFLHYKKNCLKKGWHHYKN